MDKAYYVLKDSCTILLRNKGAAVFKCIVAFLYVILLTSLFHGWINVTQLAKVEKENTAREAEAFDFFTQSNTNDSLLTLLHSLTTTLFIFSIGLLLFGIFYLFIHFHRRLILDKKEFIIKKILGSSAFQVTSEPFCDSLLLIVPSCLLGLLTAEILYRSFLHFSTFSLADRLHPSSYFLIFVDLPLISFFALLIVCQFLFLKHKITDL
ncbi:hypothetical protein A5819_002263 [Enterococcus sp. 7E2_DIV0204]|uniref:ABC3 transporter permease C-terminal domain-containing protein n=1 Tax=Candidatus Enterococcus lemimoniae TaxID=1834167 RepID=A0ABZ2T8K5_9ENTE|nr:MULTISPECIES: FtsX-like permease family protein [unclassified Enterococcus]OTN89765.1 hypothetical protein A5819_002263 [Enterococcus sp. 7E2_DIV0204]OTO68630.1 hypothetical protein A5866_000828 [Enterococcus sp. 12C11_DIV0727]OTP52221.1 hypothetical protein A5884_001422 [Enterococcus sp. 7D2_DIV0200]